MQRIIEQSSPQAAVAPRRIVLTTFGSLGDLHPYIAIALGLRARGHEPVLATSACYRTKIDSLNLGFREICPDSTFVTDPNMMQRYMHPRWGLVRIGREVVRPAMPGQYEDILAAAQGADLLISHPLTSPVTRLVAEKTGVPWVSTMITPLGFLSAYDLPILPMSPGLCHVMRAFGPMACRPSIWVAKRASRLLARSWYQMRADLGLPAARDANPLIDSHSSSVVLALFSPILAPPQLDWPARTIATGFPLYDHGSATALPMELEKFLDDGPPPIVFTLASSAAATAGEFFEISVAAARLLGRRAVLILGRSGPALFRGLPEGVAAFEYAPFSQLFPRAAAIVHPGGIGTTGLVMRSGRPALVVPWSMDHFDNAAGASRLGIARTVGRSRYTPARVARELKLLLESESIATRAAEVARLMSKEDGVRSACDAVDGLLHPKPSSPLVFQQKI